MSLRIKLPAKSVEAEFDQQPVSETSGRRKHTKRRLAVVSDDEDDEPDQKHLSNTSLSSPIEPFRERSRSVEDDYEPEEPNIQVDALQLLESSSISPYVKKAKAGKHSDGPPPPKKKRISKETHSDDDYHQVAASHDENNYLVVETKRVPRPTAKVRANREKSKLHATDGESPPKDERKTHHTKPRHTLKEGTHGTRTKRTRDNIGVDDAVVDVVGEVDTKPDTRHSLSPAKESPSPPPKSPPPKKRKLPTIKKNKGPTTTPASAPPVKTVVTSSTKGPPPKLPEMPKSAAIGGRIPPAMLGNADFDLRNESVYNELFKSAGGSTPRSGLSRREKDERRKELDRMRDVARAKRTAEMVSSFDLQAQFEKIKRYEDTLRMNHSSAVYPNFLAAKWREIWEREKRRAAEQGPSERPWGGPGEQEEGEMNSQ